MSCNHSWTTCLLCNKRYCTYCQNGGHGERRCTGYHQMYGRWPEVGAALVGVLAAVVLVFGVTGCAVEPTTTAGSSETKVAGEEKKAVITLKVTEAGKDPLGDYEYKVTLTNHTGENLDVNAFAFSGEDADGNRYDAIPGSLRDVGLADGKTVTGTIVFTTGKITKVTYEETFGKDAVTAKVR